MRIFDDKDIAAISAATSGVIQNTIGEVARVLVPAIEQAAKGALSGISVTVTIEPIVVRMEVK